MRIVEDGVAVDVDDGVSLAGDGSVSRLVVRTSSAATAWAALRASRRCEVVLLRPDVNPGSLPAPTGPGVWLATSGTTGTPKLVRHDRGRLFGRVREGDPNARWLLTYAPCAMAGVQVLATVAAWDCALVARTEPTAALLADDAYTHQVTHVSGTPTFWRAFLHHLGGRSTNVPLVQATLGGEAANQAILDRIRRRWPAVRVSHIYASTEAGAVFSVTDGHEGFPAAWLTTGIDDARLRVRDGILDVRSPRAAVDGWVHTGDRVEMVGDRVRFCGRADPLANIGGVKVSIDHVEDVLAEVDGVIDVHVQTRVSSLTGQILEARVVAADGMDHDQLRRMLIAHARHHLDRLAVPRLIMFVPDLGVGKKART